MAIVQTRNGKRVKVSPGTKGAISEHIATAFMLASGYDVFRNVSPNGRVDFLAIDWGTDETFRVDVKSEGFKLPVGKGGAMAIANRDKIELNKGFNIKYLVVKNNGDCEWYDNTNGNAANDNVDPKPTWWRDNKTAQRFRMLDDCITSKQWTYFCHWLLRAYPDYIIPFSEQFVREMSARGIGSSKPFVSQKEITVLRKLYSHIVTRLTEVGAIEFLYGDAE